MYVCIYLVQTKGLEQKIFSIDVPEVIVPATSSLYQDRSFFPIKTVLPRDHCQVALRARFSLASASNEIFIVFIIARFCMPESVHISPLNKQLFVGFRSVFLLPMMANAALGGKLATFVEQKQTHNKRALASLTNEETSVRQTQNEGYAPLPSSRLRRMDKHIDNESSKTETFLHHAVGPSQKKNLFAMLYDNGQDERIVCRVGDVQKMIERGLNPDRYVIVMPHEPNCATDEPCGKCHFCLTWDGL
jgi:hypothetical protein